MVTVRCKTSSLRTLVCILLAGYAKSQACSPVTVVTDWTGNLKSPEFPNNYPNNISCSWVLTVSPGNRIEVTTFVLLLDSYSTEDPSCPGDYLEVRQGASRVSPLIGRYCGGSVPPPFVSSSENLFMQFVTDASGSSAGFFLQHKGVCRVQLNETSGTISTPNYPQFYPTSQDCLWSIQVNPLLEITLNITTLDTEHNDNCTFDYVEVYAGVSMEAPLIGRHCGLAEGLSYARRGNLSVRFVSDGDREKMGFLATYTTRLSGTWTEWSPWTPCSVTCYQGNSTRFRMCTDPLPLTDEPYWCQGQESNKTEQIEVRTCVVSNCRNSDTTTDTRTLEIRPSQTVSAPDRTVSSGYRVLQTTDSRSNNSITPLILEPSNRQTTNLDRMSLAFTDVPQSSTIVLQTSVITKTQASNLLPKSGIPQTTALDPQTSIVTLASNPFLASGVPQSSASEPHKSIITTTRASNLFSISNIPKISSIDPQTSIAILTRASNLFSTRSVPQNSSSGHHTSLVTIYRASNTFSISGVPQSSALGPHSSDITITRASNLFSTSSVPQNSSSGHHNSLVTIYRASNTFSISGVPQSSASGPHSSDISITRASNLFSTSSVPQNSSLGHHTSLVTIYRASNTFSMSGVPQSSASGPYSSDITITRASNLFSTSSVPQNSSLGHNTSLVTISRASNTFSISGIPQSSASGPYSSDITITRASNLFWTSSLPQNSSSGHYTSVVTIYRASHTFSTRSESQNSSSRHHTSLVTISRASNTFTTSGVPKSSAALLLSDRHLPSKNSTGSSSQKISVTGKFHIVLPTSTAGLLLVSTSLEVNGGIPQGSIKGPFLTIQENGFGTVDLGSSTVNLDYSSAASTYSFNNNNLESQATAATPPLNFAMSTNPQSSGISDMSIRLLATASLTTMGTSVIIDTDDSPTMSASPLPSFPWYVIIIICSLIITLVIILTIYATRSKPLRCLKRVLPRSSLSKKEHPTRTTIEKDGFKKTIGRQQSFLAVQHHLCYRDVYYGGPLDYAQFNPRLDNVAMVTRPGIDVSESIELSCQFSLEDKKQIDEYEYLEVSCVLEDETEASQTSKNTEDYGILAMTFPASKIDIHSRNTITSL